MFPMCIPTRFFLKAPLIAQKGLGDIFSPSAFKTGLFRFV